MRPSEIYELSTTNRFRDASADLGMFLSRSPSPFPAIQGWANSWDSWNLKDSRVTLRQRYVTSDGYRGWELTVWRLDGNPFMITQYAGRGLTDYGAVFVTDRKLHQMAEDLIRAGGPDDPTLNYLGEQSDVEGLGYFYDMGIEDPTPTPWR